MKINDDTQSNIKTSEIGTPMASYRVKKESNSSLPSTSNIRTLQGSKLGSPSKFRPRIKDMNEESI